MNPWGWLITIGAVVALGAGYVPAPTWRRPIAMGGLAFSLAVVLLHVDSTGPKVLLAGLVLANMVALWRRFDPKRLKDDAQPHG